MRISEVETALAQAEEGLGKLRGEDAWELTPVLCTPDGDAAMTIGVEHALPDLDAVRQAAVRMATDPDARDQARKTAERVRDGIKARPTGIAELIDGLEDTRRCFRNGARSAQARASAFAGR